MLYGYSSQIKSMGYWLHTDKAAPGVTVLHLASAQCAGSVRWCCQAVDRRIPWRWLVIFRLVVLMRVKLLTYRLLLFVIGIRCKDHHFIFIRHKRLRP